MATWKLTLIGNQYITVLDEAQSITEQTEHFLECRGLRLREMIMQ